MTNREVKLPDPIRKRDLLFSEAGDAEKGNLLAYAEGFLKRGDIHDAVAFFVRAEAKDRLEDLLADAAVTGDFPTVFAIQQSGVNVDSEKWRRCAVAARDAGKLRYASESYRRAGDEETAIELEKASDRQSYTGLKSSNEEPGKQDDSTIGNALAGSDESGSLDTDSNNKS